MVVGGGEIFPELVCDEEENGGGVVKGERSGVVTDSLLREARRGDYLDDVEGSPGHVEAVDGGEVGEFFESGGFGLGVGGLDFATDLVHCLGDEG